MCARYSAAQDLAKFAKFFNFVCRVAFFAPRYNIAPRQQVPAIATTTANKMVAPVHDRMPVIVHPDHWLWWIDERRDGESVKSLLRPFPAEHMDCYRLSKLVNNARNDSPECIKPG